jgi:2-dehydro-3-deoxygluconokinase
MPDIVSIGECMVEFFCEGPMAQAASLTKACGGDTLNLLVAAARLGSSTGYVTRVGDDPFGPFLLDRWRAEGIDTTCAPLVPGFNGVYFISLLEGGEREFTYYRKGSAASEITPQDLDPGYLASAALVHASGITQAISPTARATVLRAFAAAKEGGAEVSYDANLRTKLWSVEEARAAFDEVIAYVDVLLIGAPDESQALGLPAYPEAVIPACWECGVEIVAVKLGAEGVMLGAEGKIARLPGYQAGPVVDTTGAGDAFGGAFLHGLCAEMGPFEAARLGNVVAGLKCLGRGAIHSMPGRGDAMAHFKRWEPA